MTKLPPILRVKRVKSLPGQRTVMRVERTGVIEVQVVKSEISARAARDLRAVIQLALDTGSLQQGEITPPREAADGHP